MVMLLKLLLAIYFNIVHAHDKNNDDEASCYNAAGDDCKECSGAAPVGDEEDGDL